MKKLVKDMKAGLTPLVMVLIFIIIVAVGVFVYISDNEEGFETENEFGAWSQDVVFEFADGSEVALSALANNNPLTVLYENEEITQWVYKLKGKATGEGYTSVKVDSDDFGLAIITIDSVSSNTVSTYERDADVINSIPITGTWKEIFAVSGHIQTVIPNSLPDGRYELRFITGGSLRYKGEPGGSWETSENLPNFISAEVTKDTGSNNRASIIFTGRIELN